MKLTIYLLNVCMIITVWSQSISGPTEVCPNFSYTFSASATVPGFWNWFKFDPDEPGFAFGPAGGLIPQSPAVKPLTLMRS